MTEIDHIKSLLAEPKFWVEAPGRVNIIGEHTDHQFYGVLPTCINRTIKIVGSIDPNADYLLKLNNLDASFPPVEFKTYDSMKFEKGSWGNYALAAYVGLMEYMSTGISTPDQSLVGCLVEVKNGATPPASLTSTCIIPKGISLVVHADLPAAAGVSSSSALTVAFIRAMIEAIRSGSPAKAEFEKVYASTEFYKAPKIAEYSVFAERHCGTAGGGMDQAIICLGKEGIALNIDFEPLVSRQVDLPEGMDLIVANTGKKSAKAESAPFMYNKRVFELRFGNLLLLEAGLLKLGLEIPADVTDVSYIPRLRDVERRLEMSLEELMELCKDNLKDEYTKAEILEKFENEKIQNVLKLCGEEVISKNETFKLKQPLLHVLTETVRVNQFVATCAEATKTKEAPQITATKLGKLMNESHYSLRDQFFNSCDELEAVTTIAREAGAYGARMTGAGWGGCCVIAVQKENASVVIEALMQGYYTPVIAKQIEQGSAAATCLPEVPVNSTDLANTCFVVAPAPAAASGLYKN